MTENIYLIYLEGNKFTFYASGMEQTLSLAFPKTGIAYSEVLDKDQIYAQIQTFLVSNKIVPSVCVILLGNDIVYQKVIRLTQQNQKEELLNNFLLNVPFDNVSQITYDSGDATYAFATNEELITTMRRGFEKLGYSITAIIPVAMIANANIQAGAPLTIQSAEYILANVEAVKQFNFINIKHESARKAAIKSKTPEAKKTRKREKILGGVFASLLVVLIVVYFTSGISTAPASPRAAPAAPPTAPTVPPDQTTGIATPVIVDNAKANLKLKIINTQLSEDKSGTITNALRQAGYASQVLESTSSATNSISFTASTPEQYKNEILTILRPLLSDFTVLLHTDDSFGAILTIGQ